MVFQKKRKHKCFQTAGKDFATFYTRTEDFMPVSELKYWWLPEYEIAEFGQNNFHPPPLPNSPTTTTPTKYFLPLGPYL